MITPIDLHDFTVPMWGSEVANYKTEIHIAKNNKREVMWSRNDTTIEHEGEKRKVVSVLKGTPDAPAFNYVTSLGILLLAEVGRRSCRYGR